MLDAVMARRLYCCGRARVQAVAGPGLRRMGWIDGDEAADLEATAYAPLPDAPARKVTVSEAVCFRLQCLVVAMAGSLVVARYQSLAWGWIVFISTLFTWLHIYMALKMMFYPVEFLGCCEFAPGLGLGWQGVVPRKVCAKFLCSSRSRSAILDRPLSAVSKRTSVPTGQFEGAHQDEIPFKDPQLSKLQQETFSKGNLRCCVLFLEENIVSTWPRILG